MSGKTPRRILLVEDESLVAQLAIDLLEEQGFTVVEAGTAKAAMQIAERDIATFYAAIVDLGLPDRAGDELVKELRSLRADLPIIVATGYEDATVQRRLSEERVVILSKPYDLAQLSAAFAKLESN